MVAFLMLKVIFPLKKETIQFLFLSNLYFQQTVIFIVNFYLLKKSSISVFDVTKRRNDVFIFQLYH